MGLFDIFKNKKKEYTDDELTEIYSINIKKIAEKNTGKSLGLKIDLDLIVVDIALKTLKEMNKLPFLNTQLKKQGLNKSEMLSLMVFITTVRSYMLVSVSKKIDSDVFWKETAEVISNVLVGQIAQNNEEDDKIIEQIAIASSQISKKVMTSDSKIFITFTKGIQDIVGMYVENRGQMPKGFSKKFQNFHQAFAQFLKNLMTILKEIRVD
tara:strand:- start:135 stop:764 length:630 start_codon:yes stop_codon:yes gene_type:complete